MSVLLLVPRCSRDVSVKVKGNYSPLLCVCLKLQEVKSGQKWKSLKIHKLFLLLCPIEKTTYKYRWTGHRGKEKTFFTASMSNHSHSCFLLKCLELQYAESCLWNLGRVTSALRKSMAQVGPGVDTNTAAWFPSASPQDAACNTSKKTKETMNPQM